MLHSLILGIIKQDLEELIGSSKEGGVEVEVEVEGVIMAAGQVINHWSGSLGIVEVLG